MKIHRIPVTVANAHYLDTTVGFASTPDPSLIPDACTWVFKVRGPANVSPLLQTIVSQWNSGGNQRGFIVRRVATSGALAGTTSGDGAATGAFGATPGITITGRDEFLAFTQDVANDQTRGWTSTDGNIWTPLAFFSYALDPVFNTTAPVRIGTFDTFLFEPWGSRIYWVEQRTGLDPAAGTVQWRFDADDYPGTGTSYVDPRGQTWTLTSAAAIVATPTNTFVHPVVRCPFVRVP